MFTEANTVERMILVASDRRGLEDRVGLVLRPCQPTRDRDA